MIESGKVWKQVEALRGAEELLTKFEYCQAQHRWTEQGDDHCDMKYTDTLLLTQCKLRMAFKQILADLTQEMANYGSFFGYSLEMKIPVAKSFGFYQLAHNLYHVDVLCPQAC